MKSFSLSFKHEIALQLLTKQVGQSFDVGTTWTRFTGKVLHRHVTPCGVLLLVKYSGYYAEGSHMGAFWLSECGQSGILITGEHTTTKGVYRKEDPDYADAIREYERPLTDIDFSEERFESLGALVG